MKKLMMFMLVAAMSVASQAAFVEWSLDKKEIYDAAYNTVYCFVASDLGTVNSLLTSSTSASDFASKLSTSGLNYSQDTGGKSGGAAGSTTVAGVTTSGVSTDLFLVFTDTDAASGNQTSGTGTGANYYVTGTANGTTSTAEASGAMATFTSTQATGTWKAFPTSGGVPEPTSGLLLALGGAMLALRRKRA